MAQIGTADLLRLAALAADAEAELFRRNPQGSGRYVGRLLGRALCQGAALHYVDGSNGVKDFDVWSFYTQHAGSAVMYGVVSEFQNELGRSDRTTSRAAGQQLPLRWSAAFAGRSRRSGSR